MAKYLVTGGAGFIGSNTVDELIAQGNEVVALDNLSEGKKENVEHHSGDKFTFIEGDIRSDDDIAKALSGVDYVIHLAASRSVPKSMDKPLEYHENNVTATLKLLIKSSQVGVKRFVLASSSSVYGETDKHPQVESDPTNPISPYAATKLLDENYCKLFSNAFNLETVGLRYFNVFGPRQSLESQYAVAIPKFTTCILKDEAPPVYDDGLQSRDFTYVGNVVGANIAACHAPNVSGEVFNVACGETQTVLHVIETINNILGKSIEPTFLPPRPGDVRKTYADTKKMEEVLRYTPETNFEDGLEKTVEWFQARQ